ncbi:MAG: ATP-binding protein [Chloroflexota bacterium]|nr:ATP-binding protein [Chloroflexota bacterium]
METALGARQDGAGTPLVVIGSSAGGVEALMTLVASLPADFAAPIVIAQHIDRTRASHLGEILAARTKLPVKTVSGHEKLVPGTVFVVPSDRDVEIDDHHVGLHRDAVGPFRPSVDRLLATAARVHGDDLIAVVLTGTGSDGAAGAQAVKAYGGTVIVQNPKTAQFPGMPEAVSPLTIDIVADIEDIGPLLVDLLSGEHVVAGRDGEDLQSFLGYVRDHGGLDFSTYKRPTITRRLQRRMAAAGSATLNDYRRQVEQHPDELQRLVASFLIKVTEFFRDPELFAHLRDETLPKLIAEARQRGELRLWSAGCATGEEAYTLAMLVTDLLDDEDDPIPVRIFATDVALDAVDFARRGVYPEAALAGLPPDLIARHFIQHDRVFEVNKRVRGLVVFGEHDLGRRAPFPRIDLVLCRNVLIYFTPELQRRSLQLFAFSLRQNGYLALGKAETVSPLPDYFTVEQARLKLYRRIGELAPIPADQVLEAIPIGRREQQRRPSGRRLAPSVPQALQTALVSKQANRLLDELSVGIVIVDQRYDIRSINIAARRLLGIRNASLGADLIHGVTPALTNDVRAAIDSALGGKAMTVRSQVPRDVIDGSRDLTVTCLPVGFDESPAVIDAVLIEIVEVTGLAQGQRDLAAARDAALASHDDLEARLAEARTEVRELRQANQTMATEQGRLYSENEYLQLAAEEAQAATEEIETLNEELQATNEELETLNEELQATVEELTTTNDELQARTDELQQMTASLAERNTTGAAERDRLAAILANMGDAVLVLDEAGATVLTNAAYERLFGATADFVSEDDHGRPLLHVDRPQQRAARGETFTLLFTSPGANGNRRWFEANSQPVPGPDDTRWSIIVLRDITERSLRHLQEEFIAIASHELRTPLTTLSGSLQLLRRRLREAAAEPRVEELVGRALEQSQRLEAHISELMDVARLQGGKLRIKREPIDLTALVRHVAETAGFLVDTQTIRTFLPEAPLRFTGDAHRLEQVLLNLITNAIAHAAESEFIDLRLRRDDGDVLFEVQDYGPGVPPGTVPHLFSRFFQAEETRSVQGGLGLGLYIAREIVVAHGGDLDVESTVGEGTTFRVRLPAAAAA